MTDAPALRGRFSLHPAASWALRIGFSAALLVIVLGRIDIDTGELLPAWNRWTPVWLAAALALTVLAFALAAVRWRQVLHGLGTDDALRRLFSHYMAGQFISNFLPSTVGGDVLRATRLSRDIDSGPVAFTSVVFERLSGWIVLPVITFFGFAVNPGLTRLGTATQVPLVVAFATLTALMVILLVVGSNLIGDSLENRTGLLRYANAVHLGIDRFREHPHSVRNVLTWAFIYQLTLVMAAWCGARAMQIDEIGPTALMAFLPAVLIVQVFPLGIGGFGLREGALVVFMSGIDVPDERAFAFGLLLGLLTLVSSLIGFPALVLGGPGRNAHDESRRDDPVTGTLEASFPEESI